MECSELLKSEYADSSRLKKNIKYSRIYWEEDFVFNTLRVSALMDRKELCKICRNNLMLLFVFLFRNKCKKEKKCNMCDCELFLGIVAAGIMACDLNINMYMIS